MILPTVRDRYHAEDETERNRVLIAADLKNVKHGADVIFTTERVVLRSPGGILWKITVSDAGALSTAAYP